MNLLFRTINILFVSTTLLAFKRSDTKSSLKDSSQTKISLPDSVVSINALYFNCITVSKAMYGWNDLKPNIPEFDKGINVGILDGSIENPKIINKIQHLIETLKPDIDNPNYTPDYRIVATVKYRSGEIKRLGISGSLMNTIYLNDTLQKKNNQLIYLIKNYLGIYPWLIGSWMNNQEELFDNSYPKDPFIESKYYKLYQQYQ